MNFMESIKNEINNELIETENGALGYRTTGKALVDATFKVSSMRNWSDQQIKDEFSKVFYENKYLAMKWLFYVRDVRQGLGERRLFRECMMYLAENHPEYAIATLDLVADYGRYDDLLCLLDTDLDDLVINCLGRQLEADMKGMKAGEPISLCAKWMPSVNTSSSDTRRKARMICKGFGVSEKEYRKGLSALREYINVVETKMSSNNWGEIDYQAVPSKANLLYSNAFMKHDMERRGAYLDALTKGEAKINSSVNFPHDIFCKYRKNYGFTRELKSEDTALEELWKALPDYVDGEKTTLCVVDGSGSMLERIGGTGVTALDVSNALGIYFAERCKGEFKDKFITFSSRPKYVDLSNANSLRDKMEIALRENDISDTDIEAVFDMILQTAINNHMEQKDLPNNILIVSDMEFDVALDFTCIVRPTLFGMIKNRYELAGYKMPRLVFWNVCSRSGSIPVRENDFGVALVSGFSPVIAKMVLSDTTDPLECVLEQLNSERYYPVTKALEGLV